MVVQQQVSFLEALRHFGSRSRIQVGRISTLLPSKCQQETFLSNNFYTTKSMWWSLILFSKLLGNIITSSHCHDLLLELPAAALETHHLLAGIITLFVIIITRSGHNFNSFLLPFCKKSLICLEGKLMTPHRETLLFSVPPSNSLVFVSDP